MQEGAFAAGSVGIPFLQLYCACSQAFRFQGDETMISLPVAKKVLRPRVAGMRNQLLQFLGIVYVETYAREFYYDARLSCRSGRG